MSTCTALPHVGEVLQKRLWLLLLGGSSRAAVPPSPSRRLGLAAGALASSPDAAVVVKGGAPKGGVRPGPGPGHGLVGRKDERGGGLGGLGVPVLVGVLLSRRSSAPSLLLPPLRRLLGPTG